ncbi:tetratricopeptide repeat protein, partial [bacterium]|nr:tetratricopeptide repeat protein [bacterium]
KMIKMFMDKSVASAKKGKTQIVSGPPITFVEQQVKDMQGLGGRKIEAEWEGLFPAMNEIQRLFDSGNIPEAIRKLIHLMKDHPNVVQIHSILGQCYTEQGRFDDAIHSFKMALTLRPNDPESLSNLAYLYSVKGINIDAALKMAKKSIEFEPNKPEFHHTLGWVFFKLGEVEKSIEEIKKALLLKPNYILARYNLGLAYYLSGSFELALDSFEQAISLRPDFSKALLFRAITLARLKKAPQAILALADLKAKLPEKEVLSKVVGELYQRLKLATERQTDLPLPNIRHPAPIAKLLKKARDYRQNGLVNRAKDLYLECQRLSPEAFEPWYELGEMYSQAGLNLPAQRT